MVKGELKAVVEWDRILSGIAELYSAWMAESRVQLGDPREDGSPLGELAAGMDAREPSATRRAETKERISKFGEVDRHRYGWIVGDHAVVIRHPSLSHIGDGRA